LDRTGRTIKYIKGITDNDEIVSIQDPYIREEKGNLYTINDTAVVKCNSEKCNKIDVKDKDFYENSKKKFGNESGTVIQCVLEDPNTNEINTYNKYIKCTLDKKISGFYTNSQKELIKCSSTGCSTTSPEEFKEITNEVPKYFLNGNVINDKENPIIICQYIVETNKDGCYINKPFRNECTNDCPKYPYTVNNLFVNSGAPMSLISCEIIISGDSDSQSKNYSCNLIEAKDFSYYITSEGETSNNNIKGSLIKCTVISNENSCFEFTKELLG